MKLLPALGDQRRIYRGLVQLYNMAHNHNHLGGHSFLIQSNRGEEGVY